MVGVICSAMRHTLKDIVVLRCLMKYESSRSPSELHCTIEFIYALPAHTRVAYSLLDCDNSLKCDVVV